MTEASQANVSFEAVRRLLRPKSVAIIGVSEDPGSMGGRALGNLKMFGFDGDIHLVSRTSKTVDGLPCLASVDELPMGVDAAIIALPSKAILPTIEACARRGVGGAVVFAAGFAEAGGDGLAEQARLTALAREADLAVLGPNTLGLTNYVDLNVLAFGPGGQPRSSDANALAILAQSGAMVGSLRMSAEERRYGVTYAIATGNEAVAGIEDFLAHIVDDHQTKAIAIYAEQLRRPQEFLSLARRARENGKPIILLHPGRSERARASAASHTGALSGDYQVMRALVESEAVIAVETLEEWLDTAEFLTRYPDAKATGPSLVTDSGALRGLSLDFSEELGVTLPELGSETVANLRDRLPAFAEISNPLDITAQGLKDMPLYTDSAAALVQDSETSGVIAALMPGSLEIGVIKAKSVLPSFTANDKPKAYVVLGDAPVDPQVAEMMRDNNIPYYRSPERALRVFAHSARYSQLKQQAASIGSIDIPSSKRIEGDGAMSEYRGKALLREAGLTVPDGGLVATADEATALANRIGYPVVLKVQSAQLLHKTEVGGVAVGLSDETALRQAWDTMAEKVALARPDAIIDGYLVETMAPKGLELVVGGRRDPNWGPVVLAGLGGIWIETLQDVQLMPAHLPEEMVIQRLDRLKARNLLDGARGAAPIDKAAVAKVVTAVGQLLLAHPEIVEIDINPLVAYPVGRAPIALDALICLDSEIEQ